MQAIINNNNIHVDDFEDIWKGDIGHSRLFVEHNQNDIKLSSLSGEGYYFNQMRNLWEKKENGQFVFQVSSFLEVQLRLLINKLSMDKKSSDKSIEAAKILKKVRTYKHAESVWRLARTELIDKDFQKKMNSPSHLLPLQKGRVIDLRTLEVRLRKKDDYFDFELPFEFLKSPLPNADKFFREIMNNDNDVVNYLQTILGYCITGETDLRSIWIFWGAGSNGKSTLCELLNKVLDKFYVAADKRIFIEQEKTSSSHTSYLIPLMHARLSVLSETKEGEKLNEALIKTLTGNDTISARELYSKQITFKPVVKYIMLTNHKPTFNIDDQALLDRIKYVPFNARFSSNPKPNEFKKDSKFIESLMSAHISEVFTWLCLGANKYYNLKGNIPIPQSLQKATSEYIKELDNVSQFIKDKCKEDKNEKVKRSSLYEAYKNYCIENGLTYIRVQEFCKRLDVLNIERKVRDGYTYCFGINLI